MRWPTLLNLSCSGMEWGDGEYFHGSVVTDRYWQQQLVVAKSEPAKCVEITWHDSKSMGVSRQDVSVVEEFDEIVLSKLLQAEKSTSFPHFDSHISL